MRLLLIDEPELDHGRFGGAARDQLAALAPPGTRLDLELDVEPEDRYGRTLAYAFLPSGRMVNEVMAWRGLRGGVGLPAQRALRRADA